SSARTWDQTFGDIEVSVTKMHQQFWAKTTISPRAVHTDLSQHPPMRLLHGNPLPLTARVRVSEVMLRSEWVRFWSFASIEDKAQAAGQCCRRRHLWTFRVQRYVSSQF